MAFRVIAAEAIAQNKRPDEVLSFAADRLKELGKEIEKAQGSSLSDNRGGGAATSSVRNLFFRRNSFKIQANMPRVAK